MRHIAPAGTALNTVDVLAGLGAGIATRRAADELSALLAGLSGHPHCWPISSGRAAMTVILRAMRRAAGDARRSEVIIPGYTCYSVPASIERAGLRPRLCDVDPQTLAMDPEKLRRMSFDGVLAVISANLYGIPNALADIEAIAAERGVYMLDDAAQCLGGKLGKRSVGGFGDAGLYSFDKGKNITTIQGGAIVARPALAAAVAKEYATLPAAPALETLSYAIKVSLYALLLRPGLYGVVQRLPGLGLGRTEYHVPSPVSRYSTVLAGLALRQARRLDAINAVRIGNAQRLTTALRDLPGITLPAAPEDSAPVCTRFPLLVKDPAKRAGLIAALNAAGIGATASYPQALVDVPEVSGMLGPLSAGQDGARQVARTIVTLPTHAYVPADMASHARAIIQRQLEGPHPAKNPPR